LRIKGNSAETFPGSSRYLLTAIPETKMDEKKKHDLRDEIPVRVTITNTESRMAGGLDNANVSTDENPSTVKPGPQNMPAGQDVKGS
jgi:hypothetical protein